MIYLDHNAATPPLLHVYERILERQDVLSANPDSQHGAGRIARAYVEESRKDVGNLIGVPSKNVIFTSCATEANAIALTSYQKASHLIFAMSTEHKSILEYADIIIDVGADGTPDIDKLSKMLTVYKWANIVLACMYANNETGIISDPYDTIVDLCEQYGVRLHIDASQCYGKGCALSRRQVSYASTIVLSGHKMQALRGVGALIINDNAHTLMRPNMLGGHQELGLRPGTLNVEAIYSMGLAANEWSNPQSHIGQQLRQKVAFIETSLSDISEVNGGEARLANTTNLYFSRITDLQLFIESLSSSGVYVSGTSACNSGFDAKSHVLEAMYGKGTAKANGSIRISICKDTSWEDIKSSVKIIREIVSAT